MSKPKNRHFSHLRKEKARKEQQFYWEDLVAARDDVVNNAIHQQNLLMELVTTYDKIITADSDLESMVKGLMLSYADVAKDTVFTISSLHTADGSAVVEGVVPNYKKGLVKVEDEEYFEYIDIAYKYCTKSEQLANLSANGFLDIFLKIKEIDPTVDVDNEFEKAKEDINAVREETSKLPTESEIQSVIDKEKNKSKGK